MQNWCSFEYSQLKVLFYFAFCSALWDLFYSSSSSSLFPSQNNRDNLICCCCLNVLLLFCCCVACSCIRLCIENDCPHMWFCFFCWYHLNICLSENCVQDCIKMRCSDLSLFFLQFNKCASHNQRNEGKKLQRSRKQKLNFKISSSSSSAQSNTYLIWCNSNDE